MCHSLKLWPIRLSSCVHLHAACMCRYLQPQIQDAVQRYATACFQSLQADCYCLWHSHMRTLVCAVGCYMWLVSSCLKDTVYKLLHRQIGMLVFAVTQVPAYCQMQQLHARYRMTGVCWPLPAACCRSYKRVFTTWLLAFCGTIIPLAPFCRQSQACHTPSELPTLCTPLV